MDPALLDQLARLRHDNLARSSAYVGGPAALAWHRDILESAARDGVFEVERHGDTLLAGTILWTEPHVFTEEPLPQLVVHRVDTPEGLEAATELLDRALRGRIGEVRCMLPLWDLPLREHLRGHGLGIASVNLAGRVDRAIAGLGDVPAPPEGVMISPLAPSDVDAVLRLHATVFSEEPLYATFGAHPGFLEKYRKVLYDDASPDAHWVVADQGVLVGYAAARFREVDPHHGCSTGVHLVLDRRARGRGLARPLYGAVLGAVLARGGTWRESWIKGMSARPQVLRLAGVMGRRITSVNLSRRDVFPDGWFDPWLEELA